jgi:hypothetical protein
MAKNKYHASRRKGADLCWIAHPDGARIFAIDIEDVSDMILALESVLDKETDEHIADCCMSADRLSPTDEQRLAALEDTVANLLSFQAVSREQVRELAGEVEKLWKGCGYKCDNVTTSHE